MIVLKDFSVLEPDPVIMKFGNGDEIKEVDLTTFPAFLSLKTSSLVMEYEGHIENIPLDAAVKFMAGNLKKLNPEITEDFLWMKCTENQVATNFTYILQRHLEERKLIAQRAVVSRLSGKEKKNRQGRSKSAES